MLQARVFEPLGMRDTGFTVPAASRHRQAAACGFDDAGRLASRRDGPGGSFVHERPAHWTYESGGQGLWSTVDDYLAFARLFVGGGAVDGVRVLKPETLAMMTRDHLTAEQRQSATMFGMPLFGTGHGFGLGVAVVIDPATAAAMLCRGGAGTVGWPGGFGGWWQADPTDGIRLRPALALHGRPVAARPAASGSAPMRLERRSTPRRQRNAVRGATARRRCVALPRTDRSGAVVISHMFQIRRLSRNVPE